MNNPTVGQSELRGDIRRLLTSYRAGDTPGEQVVVALRRLLPSAPEHFILAEMAMLRMLSRPLGT